jgi:hypothetical protein
MILIRHLTPASLAGLVVKTAKEQTVRRQICKSSFDVFYNPKLGEEKGKKNGGTVNRYRHL